MLGPSDGIGGVAGRVQAASPATVTTTDANSTAAFFTAPG